MPLWGTTMTCHDPEAVHCAAGAHTIHGDEGAIGRIRLPTGAQRTLDQIADALGVTTALLQRPGPVAGSGESACLAEASELLQAYIRIQDPKMRQRCVAFVREAATSAQLA
jgi:hypothetical protein